MLTIKFNRLLCTYREKSKLTKISKLNNVVRTVVTLLRSECSLSILSCYAISFFKEIFLLIGQVLDKWANKFLYSA
jgi:hypothetical protein